MMNCWICRNNADFKDQMGDGICNTCLNRHDNPLKMKWGKGVLPFEKTNEHKRGVDDEEVKQ